MNLAAALKNAKDDGLTLAASTLDCSLPPVSVHVASFAADEGFIYFDCATVTASLFEGTALHGKTDAMHHEPSGLLGDPKSAVDLVGADTVLCSETMSQTAGSHFSSGSGESSKMVPTLSENFWRECFSLHL